MVDSREQFEAKFGYVNWSRSDDGRYINFIVQVRWEAWQASREAAIDWAAEVVLKEAPGHADPQKARESYAAAILALKGDKE